MRLLKCLLTNNPCYRNGSKIKPQGIMVHSTGCNNPRLSRYVQPNDGLLGINNNNNHWNNDSTDVCVHAFIGQLSDGNIATYQTLPWNHRGWHAGSGKKGSANNSHISFEICEDNLQSKKYFDLVYKEAVELTAYLCKMYNLNPLGKNVVICHCEGHKFGMASNHADVMHWFPKYGKNMDIFREDVAKSMKGEVEDLTREETIKVAKEVYNNESQVFKTLKDIPDWGKPTVEKLIKKNYITGTSGDVANSLDISYDTLRILVINDRAGLYGG